MWPFKRTPALSKQEEIAICELIERYEQLIVQQTAARSEVDFARASELGASIAQVRAHAVAALTTHSKEDALVLSLWCMLHASGVRDESFDQKAVVDDFRKLRRVSPELYERQKTYYRIKFSNHFSMGDLGGGARLLPMNIPQSHKSVFEEVERA